MPNYTLHPNGSPTLNIQWHPQLGAPQMVNSDTTLSNLIGPDQGNRFWAACMVNDVCYPGEFLDPSSGDWYDSYLNNTHEGDYEESGGNIHSIPSYSQTPMNPPAGATGFPGYGGGHTGTGTGAHHPGLSTDNGPPTAPVVPHIPVVPGSWSMPSLPTTVQQPPQGYPSQPANYTPPAATPTPAPGGGAPAPGGGAPAPGGGTPASGGGTPAPPPAAPPAGGTPAPAATP